MSGAFGVARNAKRVPARSREIVRREKDKRQDIGNNPQLSTFSDSLIGPVTALFTGLL